MPRFSITSPPSEFEVPRQFEGMSIFTPLEVSVDVLGSANVVENWKTLSAAMKEQSTETTWRAAEEIFAESQVEVPFDTGNLKSSGYVEMEEDSNYGPVRIHVGYNVEQAPYAWVQHENLLYEHKTAGTKDHYLSDPYDRARVKYPDALVADLKETIAARNAPRLVKKVK